MLLIQKVTLLGVILSSVCFSRIGSHAAQTAPQFTTFELFDRAVTSHM